MSAIRKVDNYAKNCPCCGGKATITEVTMLYNIPGEIKEKVVCTNCGLTMEDSFGLAKDKWNARVENVTQLKSEDVSTKESDLCAHY